MANTSLEVAPGDALLQYRLCEIIGSGGMGVVWKAIDTKLDRQVALKLLRTEETHNERWKQRLIREAKCASALNHPGIVTIYDIHSEGEICFIAMEYISGRSLREVLQQGRLAVPQALAYATQICDALAKAHAAGIVHRDVKPANLMITNEGLVKVLDFGLAKSHPAAVPPGEDLRSVSVTMRGAAVGTPAYMSPEQAVGEEVDERSDVFSFGAVLYEMFSGAPCFRGSTTVEVVRSLLRDEPRPLRETAPELPEPVKAFVIKCLDKDPVQRYSNCVEAAHDLRDLAAAAQIPSAARTQSMAVATAEVPSRWSSLHWKSLAVILTLLVLLAALALWKPWHPTPRQRGLAVVPFTSIDAEERSQAFSLGLVMAVSTNLSGLESFQKAFWVVPVSDVVQAKVKSAREARELFGVDLAVTGSVETTGDRVRITATISDARNQRQLSSRQITTTAGDAFTLEDQLAQVVSELLQLELPAKERAAFRAAGAAEAGAEDYFLQGRGYLQTGLDDKIDPAVRVLQEAVRLDPKFAAAHAALGEAYLRKYGITKDRSWIEKAKASCGQATRLQGKTPRALETLGLIARTEGRYDEAASLLRQVVEIEPRNAQAWIKLGQAYESQQRLPDAQASFEKAIEIQPGYQGGYHSLGTYFYRIGKYDEAAHRFERALQLAPDNYREYTQLGALYIQTGRYRQAETMLKRSIELRPSPIAYNNLASCYTYQERYPEAVAMMEKAVQLAPNNVDVVANLAHAYRLNGEAAKAQRVDQEAIVLAENMLKVNPRDAETHAHLAWICAEAGEKAKARHELELARSIAPQSGAVLLRAILAYELLPDRDAALSAYRLLAKSHAYLEEVARRPELKSMRADPRFKGEK
jgi:eukaryotic-like serine/threonine-protein kinase